MKNLLFIVLLFTLIPYFGSFAQEDHKGHDEQEKHDDHDEHDGHEEGSEHHDEHGEHEETPASVGPDKGITEANENRGIKLSPEATKNFGIKTTKLQGNGPWELPIAAKLMALEEVNLYRLRDGSYKRIDFVTVKSSESKITVSSKDLKNGDEIVVDGVGFLRIAELTAFGGAPEGHSH